MVLGVPEARVAELIDVLCQGKRVVQRVGRCETVGNGRLVENRKTKWTRGTHANWMSADEDRRVSAPMAGTFEWLGRPIG